MCDGAGSIYVQSITDILKQGEACILALGSFSSVSLHIILEVLLCWKLGSSIFNREVVVFEDVIIFLSLGLSI